MLVDKIELYIEELEAEIYVIKEMLETNVKNKDILQKELEIYKNIKKKLEELIKDYKEIGNNIDF